jgi:hypothetical protein
VIQVARGRLSKQIAYDIGIAEATVKVHRARVMRKMKASSLPEFGGWPTSSSWCLTSRKAPNPMYVAPPGARVQLHRCARLRKAQGLSPTTLNVGLAHRTGELSHATPRAIDFGTSNRQNQRQ